MFCTMCGIEQELAKRIPIHMYDSISSSFSKIQVVQNPVVIRTQLLREYGEDLT